MCRLFGWSAASPKSVQDLLGPDVIRLQELSNLHRDGWGAAWLGSGELRLHREDIPAIDSPDFMIQVASERAPTGVLHLRWATGGIPVCLENTHPFVREGVAFIHNGSVPDAGALDRLVDADLLSSMDGSNDSERYFLAVLSVRRRGYSVSDAFASVLASMSGEAYPSLNAMWADADGLVVVSAYRNENKAPGLPDDYYALTYRNSDGTTMAWSTGVHSVAGEELANYTALVSPAGRSPQVVALD